MPKSAESLGLLSCWSAAGLRRQSPDVYFPPPHQHRGPILPLSPHPLTIWFLEQPSQSGLVRGLCSICHELQKCLKPEPERCNCENVCMVPILCGLCLPRSVSLFRWHQPMCLRNCFQQMVDFVTLDSETIEVDCFWTCSVRWNSRWKYIISLANIKSS